MRTKKQTKPKTIEASMLPPRIEQPCIGLSVTLADCNHTFRANEIKQDERAANAFLNIIGQVTGQPNFQLSQVLRAWGQAREFIDRDTFLELWERYCQHLLRFGKMILIPSLDPEDQVFQMIG